MYLSARAIAEMVGVRKVHPLSPDAVRIARSLGDAVGMQHLGVHLITVEPGHRSTELHAHRHEEECIYVLSGTGTAVIGDATHEIGPGDFIGCPTNGIAHEMFNHSSEPLVCLVVGQRLDRETTDFPRLGKRLYRDHGEALVVDHGDLAPLNNASYSHPLKR
jgi:uncharacterized cupin superfamily protein